MEIAGIKFNGTEHSDFFLDNMQRCRYNDVYHKALIYCLGISEDTRNHIDNIYDFKSGMVKPECLTEGWITSGSARIVRLAFNLYNDGMPSVFIMRKNNAEIDDLLRESNEYTVSSIFCYSYGPYFLDAIKIRYPEYF